jgi:hypothetical protein
MVRFKGTQDNGKMENNMVKELMLEQMVKLEMENGLKEKESVG